jgi:hypothetical protein
MSELDTKQTHAPKEKPNAFASPPANKHVSSEEAAPTSFVNLFAEKTGLAAMGVSSALGSLFGSFAEPAFKSGRVPDAKTPGKKPEKSDPRQDSKEADRALKDVGKLLDPKGKHVDAGKDATVAVHVLRTLSPAQQKLAMNKMSKADFEHLLKITPKDNRELFDSLLKNCANPERKLLLWAEYHKSKTANDVKGKHEDIPLLDQAMGVLLGHPTEKAQAVERHNTKREDIAKTTEKEVDEETKHLLARMKAGKKVTTGEIDRLAERKDFEHEIEFRQLVNITNDVNEPGTKLANTTKPTERASWTKNELTQLASGLDRLPEEATTDNTLLKEIRRSKMRKDFDATKKKWVNDPNVGGDHGDGVITVYDTGVSGSYRHTGQTSDLGDHHKGKKTPRGPLSPLEETVVHEVGHDIHDLHPEVMDKLKRTTGWTDVADKNALKTQLKAAGLSDAAANAKITQLESERADNYGKEGITVNGTTYKVDPYSDGGFLSHKEKAIPKGAEWDYARTNYKDHFAEMYTKAVHVPEKLHRDLVEQPKRNTESKEKEHQKLVDKLAALRAKGPPDPKRVEKLEADIKAAQADVDQAKDVQKMYEEQWSIMRQDVFHMNDAKVDETAKALQGHVPAGKEKEAAKLQEEFKNRAEKVVTPQQLEDLEKQYKTRMEKL